MHSPGPPTTLDVAPLRVVTRDDGDLLPAAPAPTCVGRFALIERAGKGGMGVVYAAWDPRLDRKVAIKLVDESRFGEPEDARTRLEQEARAAATLNHPNIVTIYDVGVHDGRVFLAMEFVDGSTLAGWMRRERRGWREVVEMFVEMARGLAAAHAVGIVHRDFKPDNVLVGSDGRPRIADFGLAYSREPPRTTLPSGARRSTEKSATPTIAGTPAYMAPEQFDGLDIGPAADQFAFCVALFEALFGRRPFKGVNIEALSLAVRGGDIDLPEHTGDVPAALLELVLRGLDPEPGRRHPSIEALRHELEALLHARRRRARFAAAVALGVGALAVGFSAAEAVAEQPCEDAGDIATLWSDDGREAVRTALADRGDAVVGALDRYAGGWANKRREVCEASRVHGEQSDQALALRMACLDRVGSRFVGLSSELGDGGDASMIDADAIETRLPALTSCDDVEYLAKLTNRHATKSSRSSTEQDRAWAEAVELVERALTRQLLGRTDARVPAEAAIALAEAQDLPGVRSRALAVLADLELDAGNGAKAAELRKDAVRFAVLDGHDDAAVYLMLDQADSALLEDRIAEAELHMAYFDAFIDRMTEPDARREIERRAEIVKGRLALAHGDADQAERRLAALADDDGLAELDRRALWMALGTAERMLGRPRDAFSTWNRLLALVESVRGPSHPDVAAVLNNLALVKLDTGDAAEAELLLARAEAIAIAAQGEQTPLVAAIATNRGWSARLARRDDDARAQLERALTIGRATVGPRHP
ncbi:MAG TPA: serine/threonine-protein kinase, partial [Nannocystaceae bacterium]|nr:serine/threonine-protein kinase [Nannocystaceae bacterium]